MAALNAAIKRSYILAYKEDVTPLANALSAEGFNPTTLRASYSQEELSFARATRCFMNHHSAWLRAVNDDGYTLICESDFVPCIGVGSCPTFWPSDDDCAWGYLYLGSPRLLALIGNRPYLRAHCAPLVAYVINARVAGILCDFFEHEMKRYSPAEYFTFDAHLQWYAMGRGARAFMPLKHYGEHGGLPNPEHKQHGLSRAGRHRADNLAGPLCFRPQYAANSVGRFMLTRAYARMLGFGRLLSNRWVVDTNVYTNSRATKLKMNAIGLRRLLL